MTWVYISLAVVCMGWFVWAVCRMMYLMGRDVPPPPEWDFGGPVECNRCGKIIHDAELTTHTCGTDNPQ